MFIRPSRLAALALLAPLAGACASASPYAGLPADTIFEHGRAAFEREDWEEAAKALDRLLLTFQAFDRVPEARMMLARAYYNDGKFLTAQQEFTRFLERHPGHADAPQAALGRCRAFVGLSPIPERDQTYTDQAAQVCANVVRDYTGVADDVATQAGALANDMRARLGEKVYLNGLHYFERKFWDSAVIYLEWVYEDYGDTEWAPRAILRLVEIYGEIGYEDEVDRWRQILLDSYPDSPEAESLVNGGVTGDPGGPRGGG
jgi:outer membrane assembly lipoprotein YfiO